MWPARQIEIYANGTVRWYDQEHMEDADGKLSEAPLDLDDFAPFEITKAEFESVWASRPPANR
jgi:hypothetical protein